jgi:hypothetical protein
MAEEEIVESSLPVIEDVNLEEFISDADKQQREYTAQQELKPIIQVPKRTGEPSPISDFLFGPRNVELSGDSFLTAGKAARRIAERVAGVKEQDLKPLGDIDPITGFVGGVIDASIKIPYGVVSLTAEIADALGEEGIPVDQGKVAQLEKYFSDTVFGKIQQGAEDVVKDSAVGRLTSALSQLYAYGKVGASYAVKGATKAKQIYNKWSTAAKANKVALANPNAVKAGLKAKDLNKLSGKANFAAVTLGGAGGTSLVTDVEDIGTWGDWLGGPSALDRETRETSQDDALRKLYNRFKFGAEGAIVSVPIAYGINTIAKRIADQGRALKYSDDELDQWIAKYVQEPFLPEGRKDRFLFEGMKRVEGELAGGQVVARDLIIDIDQTLYRIAKESGIKTSNPAWKRIAGRLDELLTTSTDSIQGGKIVFKGFDQKKLNDFKEFSKEVGLSKNNADTLIGEMFKVRNQFNVLKNTFLKESKGNLNLANKEFMDIMSERMNNIFSSEYKIFTDKSFMPYLNYKPTESAVNEVKEVFKRYARENNVNLTEESLDSVIQDILKNVRFNTLTKTPEFPLTVLSVLDDNAAQYINIADNIKGFQFKPTTLIKAEKDLRAFQRFFGQKRDLRNTIINTMSDLSGMVAKNRFYENILNKSKELIANGERAIVYPTRLQALNGLKNQKIITDKTGLKLQSPLGQAAYTSPLDGYFTSEGFKDALNFSERLITDGLAQNIIYQHMFLIPKGLTQISKTILGPFTHTRNFITSAQFSLGTGNLFKNPVEMVRNFKEAFNTIQPQLLYRNTPKEQALYRFLLEEQVTSSSATQRDIAGLLDDIGRGGDVYMRIFGKFGRAMKKIYEKAGDFYVAEDDFFKVYNFLAEFDSYKKAYTDALKQGRIKTMPNDLTIMKEAANIVKNTVPNYNFVGPFGQNIRRAPIGNFVSFPIEVTRTATGILSQGLKEARNPLFRNIGIRRLIGFGSAVVSAPAVITGMLKGMYGVTTATYAAIRELVTPSYMQDSTIGVIKDEKGNLKFIDVSAFLVYDTVQNPIISIIASVEKENMFAPNEPLTIGVGKGLARGVARFMRPFVDESIYLNVFNNILIRKGVTADGRPLWNQDAPDLEKIQKALEYAAMEVAPLSAKQFQRMYDAMLEKPGARGDKYEVSDELAGFYGLRSVPVKPLKSLNFKINDFKEGLRNTIGLFTADTQKGGSIEPNTIIERYIVANGQRYKTYNEMQRKIKAAQELNTSEDSLNELFSRRGERKNFNSIMNNEFRPMGLTKGVKQGFQRIEEEIRQNFDDATIPVGLPEYVEDILNSLQETMQNIPLGDDFGKYIRLEDWLIKDDRQGSIPGAGGERQVTQVPPLPEQPMPNPQIITPPMPQMSQLNQGLTPAESALLSEEDKQIRLRQRGLG